MDNLNFLTRAKDAIGAFLTSKVTAFFAFAILMTAIIASQNFFFQSIIENGISKKDIIAQKTLTVVDVKRTEQHKKKSHKKSIRCLQLQKTIL